MLLRQFLIPIFFLYFQHALAEDDPLWFPNLACRPNHDEAAIASLRELAKKCNNFKKGDACAMHCVLQEWDLADTEQDEIAFRIFEEFLPKIYKDEDFAKLLGETIRIACKPFALMAITLSETTTMTPQCSHNPRLYHCVESYLNCSRNAKEHYSPPDIYDLSCHPEYDNTTVDTQLVHEQIDRKCKWEFPDNHMCGMQCVLSQDMELPNRIRSYRQAIADHDQTMANTQALNIAGYIPRLTRYRELTEEEVKVYGKTLLYIPEGIHIGKKIAENCAPLFVEPVINEKHWMHTVPCTDVSDEWKKYINCVDDIWKCRA